jgi:hypothetical protein
MNLNSFVYGVLSYQEEVLSTEDALCFKETLAILLDVPSDVHFDTTISRGRLSEELGGYNSNSTPVTLKAVAK